MNDGNSSKARSWLAPAFLAIAVTLMGVSSASADLVQGFETDTSSWTGVTRVTSGTGGIPASSGGFYAQAPQGSFTNWGGYNTATIPYTTSIDIYLNMSGGFANDSRFAYTSAVNKPDGTHRRDFVFSGGFYPASNTITNPGSGQDRFIFSASNNAPGWPADPSRSPVAITQTGWYTFTHEFRDNGSGVLEVEMSITDSSDTNVGSWTLSDPSDVIGSTVGGNRYGWFPNIASSFGTLAIDNTTMFSAVPEPSAFLFGGLVCGVIGLVAGAKKFADKTQKHDAT